MKRGLALLVCAIALAAHGCGKRAEPSEEAAAPVTLPKPPTVTDAGGAYVLRYFSAASGELLAVKTPGEVPEGARGQVLVAPEDPNLQGPWLFVADLTKKTADGYEVRVIDRAEIEKQMAAVKPAPEPPPAADEAPVAPAPGMPGVAGQPAPQPAIATAAKDNDVIIYRTSWCGYCKKAAAYLTAKGVKFVEKDIEKDPGARQDMLNRAQKAGVPQSALQGVPILAVKGKIITGFDRNAIDRALGG
jgi:glutaredoxin